MLKFSLYIAAALVAFAGYNVFFEDKEVVYEGSKIKGVCFVAPHDTMQHTEYEPVKQINAEWVAITPYGFCKKEEPIFHYPKVKTNETRKWQWWGERPDGAAKCIEMAHQKGLKVMLKPHVWVRDMYTGDLDYGSDENWAKFEKDYREYVLDFARVADSTDVEIYCIATEFHTFVAKRPQFWKQLIKEVKQIYKGKLTYAENWDKYQDAHFWDEMDFVGIDAYFPLSEKQSPNLDEIKKGWKSHLKDIEKYSRKAQKPILFTEIGYQSTDFTTHKPWESYSKHPDNEKLQVDAYQAFFDMVWQQKWFAGAFVWKWFPFMDKNDIARDKYSPQNKPAQAVLKDNFGKK
jgi:hypothetical protein